MPIDHPYQDTIAQIQSAITASWESIAMTLDQHPPETLGNAEHEGTGAWHLYHAAEVFRQHAKHLVGPETDSWPRIPTDPAQAVAILKADADRLARWAQDHLRADTTVSYGGEHSASEMLGIMLRHIVWHAAAAHYWCKWKRPLPNEQT